MRKPPGESQGVFLIRGGSMLDLSTPKAPFDIALPYGLLVTVTPLTTAGMAAAQVAARRAVEAIERQARERTEAGLPFDGLPDLSPRRRAGRLLPGPADPRAGGSACHEVDRVELEDGPAPSAAENVAAAMDVYPVASASSRSSYSARCC
jgi:hypothetical protein